MIELPKPALFLAGKAFLRYRRQGGTKSNVLGDFYIGAHASVACYAILTRATRYAALSNLFPQRGIAIARLPCVMPQFPSNP